MGSACCFHQFINMHFYFCKNVYCTKIFNVMHRIHTQCIYMKITKTH